MAKFWLTAVMAGLLGAAAWLTAYTGTLAGMVLSYLAPAPLFMAGLGLGAAGGGVAAISGAVLVLSTTGLTAAVVYFLTIAAPTALLVRQAVLSRVTAAGDPPSGGTGSGGETENAGATEWYPPGLLAAWLTVIGMAGLSTVALYLLAEPAGIEGTVHAFALEVAGMLKAAGMLQAPEPDLFAEIATPLLPGLMVAAWMVMLMLNGALAQTMLGRTGRNLRPAPDIAELALPGWIAPAGAAAALTGLLAADDLGYFGRNMVAVLAAAFFFQGVAVVHALVRRTANARPLLAIFYVLLVVLGWLALPVAILGLADQIAGFRGRLKKNR